jgi:hypothetical protein
MAVKPITSGVLCKAFHAALLLTGSVEEAEAAVLGGISCLDLKDEAQGERLVRGALKRAIARRGEAVGREPEATDDALALLPLELGCVRRLPAEFRDCFVLRVLVGLPRDVCASLLNWDGRRVDEVAGGAAQMLAEICAEEEEGVVAASAG